MSDKSYPTEATINEPELSAEGRNTKRAIEDSEHAAQIANALRQTAIDGRIKTAGQILSVYNANPPFDQAGIDRASEDWRNNFSTRFLSSIIDRVRPQFPEPLNTDETLTYSALPEDIEDAARKTKIFQACLTKLIRSWPQWNSFLSGLTLEEVIHGSAAAIWMDDDWRPRYFGFGDFYLPQGTMQHACKVQYCAIFQPILINEFTQLFRDRKAAELAHYEVDNCIKVANEDSGPRSDDTAIDLQDKIREGSVSDRSRNEQRVIEVYHILVSEYGGGVDLWTVSKQSKTLIRYVKGLHKTMEEALTLFTLQAGNDKYYGSLGLGRQLANIALSIERNRCQAADQIWLSGLGILRGDRAAILRSRPVIKSPFILIDKELELSKESIEFNSEGFEMFDNKMVALAESIAGSFIPPNLDNTGSSNTKIEAAQKAEREQAIEKGVLGRFIGHAGLLVSTMQKKICNAVNLKEGLRLFNQKKKRENQGARTIRRDAHELLKDILGDDPTVIPMPETMIGDPDAVDAIMEMLEKGLSIQEIAILSVTPAGNDEKVGGADRDLNTVNFITENMANPMIDLHEATQMAGEIRMGLDRIKRILLKKDDPNVESQAIRQQTLEDLAMRAGEDMPVVSTDRHDIHRQIVGKELQQLIPAIQQAPQEDMLVYGSRLVKHGLTHLAMDTTAPEDQRKQEEAAFGEIQKLLSSQIAAIQKAKEEQQAQQAQPQNGQEQPTALDHQASDREDARALVDMHLRATDQQLRAKDQQLKEQQQAHDQTIEKAKLATDADSNLASMALEEKKLGIMEADKDEKKNAAPSTK